MNRKLYRLLYISILLIVASCKKPYSPPQITFSGSYLVVEGSIVSGADSTIISLSRTVNLSSKITTNPLTNAILTVEGDQNTSYQLTETQGGKYVAAGLNLDNTHKYRLRIKTQQNTEYLSDFVPVKNSPAIDSINYTIQSNGLNIYSNTHDPNNNTLYYRWDYKETWIFHSNYDSEFKSNGDTVLPRNLHIDDIYTCWQTHTSSTIVLGSSAKLSKDVIVNNPITFVPSTSEKVGVEYSILVRQYALTSEAYNFYQNIKKNTEQLGSIFDAEPSQLKGNIHNTANAKEPVIGYISVGSTSSKRIFIRNQQLPAWLPTPIYPDCQLDTALLKFLSPGAKFPVNEENEFFNINKGSLNPPLIPVSVLGRPGLPPLGHTGASPQCVDCTLRGTNKQPSFWVF